MTKTLSIRLTPKDRETLETAAKRRGLRGVSTLVRDLAEREAQSLRMEEVRSQFQPFMDAQRSDPKLRAELNDLGTPQGSPLDSEPWWPTR